MNKQTRIFGGWQISPDSRGQKIHGGFDVVVRGTRAASVAHVDDPPVIPPHDAELCWRSRDPDAAEAWLSGVAVHEQSWAERALLEDVPGGYVYQDPDIPGLWFASRSDEAHYLGLDDGPHPYRQAAVERCADREANLSLLEDVAFETWIRTGGREVGLAGLIEQDREAQALASVPVAEALLHDGSSPSEAIERAWPAFPLWLIDDEARRRACELVASAHSRRDDDRREVQILADRAIHLLSDALGEWAEGGGHFPEGLQDGWQRETLWVSEDLGVEVLGGPMGAHRRPTERGHSVRLMDERVEASSFDALTETEARLLAVTLAVLPSESRRATMVAMRFGVSHRSFRDARGLELSTLVSMRTLGRGEISVIADLSPPAGEPCTVELVSSGEAIALVHLSTCVLAERLDALSEALLGAEDEEAVQRLLAEYTVSVVPDRIPEWFVGAS